jgi:DNA-binding XRE family transcriptional regulator
MVATTEDWQNLYHKVQPPAEAIKGYIQIGIGIAVIIVFAWRCVSHPPGEFNIAQEALRLVGYGLAASAAVELAYTFFTKGPDEALDPLILGVSSFTLIALSRIDPPRLKTGDTIPISLLALVILLLFLARRFLLEVEMEAPQLEDSDARLTFRLGQAVRERRMNLHLSQDDLATRAGITQRALAEIEAGQTLPTIPILQLISVALSAELVIDIAAQKEG